VSTFKVDKWVSADGFLENEILSSFIMKYPVIQYIIVWGDKQRNKAPLVKQLLDISSLVVGTLPYGSVT
jgi:hypothetical protein